jgi:hypothetical protein
MTPHRLYKLNYEFPIGDTLVGLVSASISYELFKMLLGERIAMPLCLLTGVAIFFLWLTIKRFLPRNFIRDILEWLVQPTIYAVTRDDETPPLVLREEEPHARVLN